MAASVLAQWDAGYMRGLVDGAGDDVAPPRQTSACGEAEPNKPDFAAQATLSSRAAGVQPPNNALQRPTWDIHHTPPAQPREVSSL
jgi:hypothetical protein